MWHPMELYILLLERQKKNKMGVGQLVVIWDLEQVTSKMSNTSTAHYSKTPPQGYVVKFNFFFTSVYWTSVEYGKRKLLHKKFRSKH